MFTSIRANQPQSFFASWAKWFSDTAPDTAPMEQVKLTRKRLLFVDDEPAIRKTLSVILARYGFAVTVAGTVAEAIDEIKTKEFDLLLSDLNIDREGDGYEFFRAMGGVNPHSLTF